MTPGTFLSALRTVTGQKLQVIPGTFSTTVTFSAALAVLYVANKLNKTSMDERIVVLDNERCCGHDLYWLGQLEKFDDGSVIGAEQLSDAGLIDSSDSMVKILGNGELTKKLEISAHKFSRSAEQKIVNCGGSVTSL